jgi:hypothetical protein
VTTALAAAFVCAAGSGCATRVYPPASPLNPTSVYLCDYGVHSSLLLPTGDGRFVEYVYGDWAYAAMNETDPLHTLGALLFSLQPALGRRFMTPPPGDKFPLPPNQPNTVTPIVVDGEKVAAVVNRLNTRFLRHINTALPNTTPNYAFMFVKDDQHYSAIHSCNHLTLEDLIGMGCTIGGFPILSNFIVEPPGGPFPARPVSSKPGN